jgi:hypothetical protein
MELLTGGELFSRIRTGQYNEKGALTKRIVVLVHVLHVSDALVTYLDPEGDTALSSPSEAARLVREIVRTVAQAHSRGVIIRSDAGTTVLGSHPVCQPLC